MRIIPQQLGGTELEELEQREPDAEQSVDDHDDRREEDDHNDDRGEVQIFMITK